MTRALVLAAFVVSSIGPGPAPALAQQAPAAPAAAQTPAGTVGNAGRPPINYETARLDRTRRAVEGSAANAGRFHNRALADAAAAQHYIDTEWDETRVAERYEWLFRYDVTRATV